MAHFKSRNQDLFADLFCSSRSIAKEQSSLRRVGGPAPTSLPLSLFRPSSEEINESTHESTLLGSTPSQTCFCTSTASRNRRNSTAAILSQALDIVLDGPHIDEDFEVSSTTLEVLGSSGLNSTEFSKTSPTHSSVGTIRRQNRQ